MIMKKWIFRVSFVVVFVLLLIFQWIPIGFFDSLKPLLGENSIALDIIFTLINWLIQLGLPLFLFWKGFIQK